MEPHLLWRETGQEVIRLLETDSLVKQVKDISYGPMRHSAVAMLDEKCAIADLPLRHT